MELFKRKRLRIRFTELKSHWILSYKNLTVLTLLLVGSTIAYHQFVRKPFAETNLAYSELNNLQEMTLDKLTQMTELLISLSTAIVGLIGYLTLNKYQGLTNVSEKEKFYAIACISSSTLSIYFGYTCLDKWVELLANEMFNPFDPIVETPHKYQFIYFFLSLILLGIYILATLNTLSKPSNKDDVL